MSEPEKRSFNERLRDRYFGRHRPEHANDAGQTGGRANGGRPGEPESATESVLPKTNQMGFFGRVQRPGGFDRPPEEPVELEGPLPWELGGDDTDRSDPAPKR